MTEAAQHVAPVQPAPVQAAPAPGPAPSVDRGSRAETIAYGGGLRATSTRIAIAGLLGLALAATLTTLLLLANSAAGNRFAASVVPAGVVPLEFTSARPLERILVAPGERVRPGQLLALQSDPALRARITEARVVVGDDTQRLADLRTVLALVSPPHPSRAEQLRSATARAELAGTDASLASAQLRLSSELAEQASSELRSPIEGVVLGTAGVPGELVGPGGVKTSDALGVATPPVASFHLFPTSSGATTNLAQLSQPVVSLVQGRRWQVVAEVPEAAIARFSSGVGATFRFDEVGGLSVPARVATVVPSPIEVNGQVEYEVLLRLRAALPRGVLPGMSGTVSLAPAPAGRA